jgi:PKD domain
LETRVRKLTVGLLAFGLFFLLRGTATASDYRFDWDCIQKTCTFVANPQPLVLSYDWKFGDGTYGTGQSTSHEYPGGPSGFYTPRVTLTYHLSNGSYINARCYIQYYWSNNAGGDPTPDHYSGTCDGFN